MVRAFNTWMDKYIADPKAFDRELVNVMRHLEEINNGEPVTYGDRCVATMERMLDATED